MDWQIFHFLENLLIFCTESSRSVPPESPKGVHFYISSKAKNEAICVLFHIDRGNKDSLFVKEQTAQLNPPKRPDYMVLYAKGNTCIVTIIEMKGKTQQELKRGIQQIVNFKNKLKKETQAHLPNKLNLKIQGILLAPNNAKIPWKEIEKVDTSQGLIILPLRVSRKAELFDYISKENQLSDLYKPNKLPHDREAFGLIEKILIKQALPSRIEDSFQAKKWLSNKEREGIYINYALSADEYAVLLLNNNEAIISIKQDKENFKQEIEEALAKMGITLTIVTD